MYAILARRQQNPNSFQCLYFTTELEAVFKYYKYQPCQQQLQDGFPSSSLRLLRGRAPIARKTDNKRPQKLSAQYIPTIITNSTLQ